MGFGTPKIPGAPPPAPTPPSLPAILSTKQKTTFGDAKGSLGGTFITGAGMNNVPGSTGQSGMKASLGT